MLMATLGRDVCVNSGRMARLSEDHEKVQTTSMVTVAAYIGAAIAEIAGCFAFWAWLRLERSVWWALPGIASLAVFAFLLTLVESAAAGRVYAAYGGVYIVSSLAWLWFIEGVKPDRWDAIGAMICLTGAALIIMAPRTTT